MTPRNKKYKSINMIMLGPEPDVSGDLYYGEMLNWYHYAHNHKDSIKFLLTHLKSTKKSTKIINSIKKIEDWKIPSTLGWIARLMDRGYKPSEKSIEFFDTSLNNIVKQAKAVKKKPAKKKIVNIQSRINDVTREVIGELEEKVDEFINNGYKSDFDTLEWLKSKSIKRMYTQKIIKFYSPLLEELNMIKTVPDLKEGYSSISTQKINAYKKFIRSMISSSEQWAEILEPQKKKKPIKLNVKYLGKSVEYKMSSISPSKIKGKKELWAFNIKTRQLIVYKSTKDMGFDFKGSTLQNVDTAINKMIRKPNITLPIIKNGGKILCKKTFVALTTKEKNHLTNRLNGNILLIKVF